MAKNKREYVIPFIGLKIGNHTFDFNVTDSFFEQFEYSIIQNGNLNVSLILEKKETMMIGNFSCKGEIETNCYRCDDSLKVNIEGSFQLIFKLGNEISDDETLIVLPPESFELDVAPYIYELITVSLPNRIIHSAGECNEEMVLALNQFLVNPEEEEEWEEWDDEDFDDEWDDDEWEEDYFGEEENDDQKGSDDDDIDPRWSILKNLN